ncbi:hypothetical protein Acr_21g0002550 [Actinidia rufa]|uniref:Uncharacterized protein n=1 Tax=Actinidia rufa TaxID=165716 RepID=A0A7J0GFS2_9ERIC|nr:hypothetical protein Acr_21g0002550 [Actinidia rufa]
MSTSGGSDQGHCKKAVVGQIGGDGLWVVLVAEFCGISHFNEGRSERVAFLWVAMKESGGVGAGRVKILSV